VTSSVAARGCLPPWAIVFVAATLPKSDLQLILILVVTTKTNSLNPSCNANANSPEAAKFQNSIFFPLQMPPPAQCRPGRMPLFVPPLSAATGHRCGHLRTCPLKFDVVQPFHIIFFKLLTRIIVVLTDLCSLCARRFVP